LTRGIALCQEWINNLSISFCSECSALQKWFPKKNTSSINICPCLHIVQCIYNRIQGLEEIMPKHRFCIWSDRILVHPEFANQIWIHHLNCFHCSFRFEFAHVRRSEKELPIEIGLFNTIEVRHCQIYSFASANSHHCPIFKHFTANCSSSDEEKFQFGKSLMEVPSEYNDLSIIS
jgi:hypothetical protein